MSDPARFRLATLNLLANPDRIDERVDLLIAELRVLRPDALCLQEVLAHAQFDIVQRVADSLGWSGVFSGPPVADKIGSQFHGTAILAPEALQSTVSLTVITEDAAAVPECVARLTHRGRDIALISAHLSWGGAGEFSRQRQALMLNANAASLEADVPGTTVLIGGDFNAVPTSDTARFFDGHTTLDGRSTVWVDAWTLAGDPSNEMTSRNDNSFAHATAKSVGISHPSMIPERRIDYLKSFGWAYGRSGHPLDFGRWATSETDDGLSVSDHYGIWADFLLV